jgi:hypothetical protein
MSWTNLHERLYGESTAVLNRPSEAGTPDCLRIVVRDDPEFVTGKAHTVEVFEGGAWNELCAHAYPGDASRTLCKAMSEHQILHGY